VARDLTELTRIIRRIEAKTRTSNPLAPSSAKARPTLEALLEGTVEETERGKLLVVRRRFPVGHRHGAQPLLAAREATPAALAVLSRGGETVTDGRRLLYLDTKTYLVELLMKQDQMSMAASVESRVPFLDHKLVEFAARVPARYKVRFFSGKYLLRRAMAKRLPAAILRRTKKGFPTPIQPWLRNQLFDKLSAILTNGRMAERGVIKPEYVHQLLRAHRSGTSSATEGCWRLLNFELWNRIFIDGEGSSFAGHTSCNESANLGAPTLAAA